MHRILASRLLSIRVGMVALAGAGVVGGALLTQASVPPRPQLEAVTAAGPEMMRMVREEHALFTDLAAMDAEARRHANAAADRAFDRLQLADDETTPQPAPKMVQAPMPLPRPKIVVAEKPRPRAEPPVRVASRDVIVGEPMQIAPPPPPPPLVAGPPPYWRVAEGGIRMRLRQIAATMERVPRWVDAQDGWFVETLPRWAWPRRDFRASL